MNASSPRTVIGKDGLRGTIQTLTTGAPHPGEPLTLIRVESGHEFWVSKDKLKLQEDGTFYLPYSQSELEIQEAMKGFIDTSETVQAAPSTAAIPSQPIQETPPIAFATPATSASAVSVPTSPPAPPVQSSPPVQPSSAPLTANGTAQEERVIPVVQEEVTVDRQKVETGKVRVNKVVREREEVVNAPIIKEEVEVSHVAINKEVEGPLPIRMEGDTTIISLVEEEVVIQKRWVLKEEVHLRMVRTEIPHTETVQLKAEEVQVDRVPVTETATMSSPATHPSVNDNTR